VVAFSSQPLWLSWTGDGRTRRHAPDYFARLADGAAVVIDARADDQIPAQDAQVFEMTAARARAWAGATGGPGRSILCSPATCDGWWAPGTRAA